MTPDLTIASSAEIKRGPTYCTAQDIADMLRLVDPDTRKRLVFTETTETRKSQVENFILMAEDYLDAACNDSWRTNVYEEYRDLIYPLSAVPRQETPVRLTHCNIRQFDKDLDIIMIWNGSAWVDYLNNMTEGRTASYWADYQKGIIYFMNVWMWSRLNGIKLRYRWGKTSVPYDIKEAAIKLAATKIVDVDWARVLIPQNPFAGLDRNRMVEKWANDVESVVAKHRRPRIATFTR